MKYELDFQTTKKHGFRLVKEEDGFLEFERGSLFLNMYTFNPLKWKSNIKIVFSIKGKVKALFNINTKHQFVIPKEVDKWVVFIENYESELK